MKTKIYRLATPFITIISLMVATLSILFSFELVSQSFALEVTISILIGILASSLTALMFNIMKKTPATFSISLLGFPSSGKTVYLTLLFNELQRKQFNGISFTPYGGDTIERVMDDIYTLRKGRWLLRTTMTGLFFYRAIAAVSSGMFGKQYKIEIGDYAGEKIKEFDIKEERWLHKSEYFKFVLQSDAIFLMIDTGVLLQGDSKEIPKIETSMITAVQLIRDSKGIGAEKKLDIPLAIIFSKSDLLPKMSHEEFKKIEKKIPQLIEICERNCRTFKIIHLSSVGKIKGDGSPPSKIKPFNIVDPLIWVLNKI